MSRRHAARRSMWPAVAPACALLACAVLATGCGGVSRAPRTSPDELAQLKERLVEAQRKAVVGEVEMQRLTSELATAKAELRAAREELEKRRSSGPVKDGFGARDLGLAGKVDEAELEEPRALPVPEPVQRIESAPAPPPAPLPSGTAPIDTRTMPSDPQLLYDQAYTLFHQKQYHEAERFFAAFLDRHSDSDLADNALFWVGECRFARGELQQALMAFLETVERFPTGNKVADALLKAGKCLESLGRKREAIGTYEEIGQRFPGSGAALSAEERLAVLRVSG